MLKVNESSLVSSLVVNIVWSTIRSQFLWTTLICIGELFVLEVSAYLQLRALYTKCATYMHIYKIQTLIIKKIYIEERGARGDKFSDKILIKHETVHWTRDLLIVCSVILIVLIKHMRPIIVEVYLPPLVFKSLLSWYI